MNQSGDRLRSGQLGTADVTASTVANIGPGIDFYFGFGVIAVTAGVAAPLTILAATVAVGLLAFTVAEFTRAEPSAGSFITYVDTALGARAGAATALLVTVGYTVAIAAVFTMSGGLVALTLAHYTSWHPWWGPISLVLTAGAIWLTARGVKLSSTAVGAAVLVQVAIMLAVCLLTLVDQRAHLSGIPFSWAHLTGGLAGLSAGFPLALFMFIGWENGPALAEEARSPRFDGGRTGLLPARLGHIRSRSGTPVNALLFMAAAGLGIIGVWWVAHLITGDTGSMDPVGLYAECSTMATIVILFVYLLTMLALPVFMWRRHRDSFSPIRHVVIPALGCITLIVPFVELCQPGQPAPYNAFPFIALALVVAAAAIACLIVHRHPWAGAGEGTAFPGA